MKTGSRVAVDESSLINDVVEDNFCDSKNVNFLKMHKFLIKQIKILKIKAHQLSQGHLGFLLGYPREIL